MWYGCLMILNHFHSSVYVDVMQLIAPGSNTHWTEKKYQNSIESVRHNEMPVFLGIPSDVNHTLHTFMPKNLYFDIVVFLTFVFLIHLCIHVATQERLLYALS